jgi:hypothetical protein
VRERKIAVQGRSKTKKIVLIIIAVTLMIAAMLLLFNAEATAALYNIFRLPRTTGGVIFGTFLPYIMIFISIVISFVLLKTKNK